MKILHLAAFFLTVAGAISVGLSAAGFDIFKTLLGAYPMVERVVEAVVGLAGAWLLVTHFTGDCKGCEYK